MVQSLNFEPIQLGEMRQWMANKFNISGVKQIDALDHLLQTAETCTVDRLRLARFTSLQPPPAAN
jgi:hypothetical protein